MELYDYQSIAVNELRRAFAQGFRAPLLVLPTGGGKTVCFAYMALKAWEKGRRVLVVVHRKELLNQCAAALEQWGVPHGRVAQSARISDEPVQVAMVQTLARRVRLDGNGRYRFDLVIIDEAHHATAASGWGEVMTHNQGARFLGVTATPCRLDGKGLGVEAGGFFDRLVVGPTVQELIDRGRLARPVVFSHQGPDLAGIKQRGGDYQRAELAAAVDRAALIGDAVGHYREHLAGAPSIAFTVTVAHSEHVAEVFRASGYSAAVLTGSTPDRERERMIRDLGAGALNVLCSCNVVSEGTDIPAVMGALLLRPTASYALAMQQMGRVLRALPGKNLATILDHAGNCWRHGLPNDPVEWSLENGAKKKKAAAMKACFGCGATVGALTRICPGCGRILMEAAEVPPGEPQPELDLPSERDGRLVELTPELRRARREEERRARSVEDLARVGTERGYRWPVKWAEHRWGELHGGRS